MRSRVAGTAFALAAALALPLVACRDPDCVRRGADEESPPGYAWSVACDIAAYPYPVVLSDGSVALRLAVVQFGDADLGGQVFDIDGESELLARFDGDGRHRWSELVRPVESGPLQALSPLPGGGVALGVAVRGPFTIGDVTHDADPNAISAAIVALDPEGRPRWSRALATSGADPAVTPVALATASDGSIAVQIDASGPLWVADEGPFDVEVSAIVLFDGDGGLRRVDTPPYFLRDLAADGSLLLANGQGFARTDPGGALQWSRALDTELFARFTPAGDVLITGSFGWTLNLGGDDLVKSDYVPDVGNLSVFVARYAGGGEHRWSLSLDDSRGVFAVDIDGAEAVTLVTRVDDDRVRVVRLDPAGEPLDTRTTPPLAVGSAAILPGGDVILAGTSGTGLGRGDSEPSMDSRRVWFAKYSL